MIATMPVGSYDDKMSEDLITEIHSKKLARDYNLCDVANLKTERITTKGTPIASCWFATKNRNIRCFVQYDHDILEE